MNSGPDYTFAAAPSTVQAANGDQVSISLIANAVAGYSDTLVLEYSGGNCLTQGNLPHTMAVGSQVPLSFVNDCQAGTGTTLTVTAQSGLGFVHVASIVVNSLAQPDFTISVGPPTPATLGTSGSIVYPITMTPLNSFGGAVTLTYDGLPDNASLQFDSTTLSSGHPSTNLTITNNGTTLGGLYNFTVIGTAGGTSRQASFPLAVQGPTITGGVPSVYNNGQTVTVQYNVSNTTIQPGLGCTTADQSQVQCSIVGTSPVTLQVTALSRATHGHWKAILNGNGVQLDVNVDDMTPVVTGMSPGPEVAWADFIPITIYGYNFTGCFFEVEEESICWSSQVDYSGPGYFAPSGGGADTLTGTLQNIALSGGTFEFWADNCASMEDGFLSSSQDMSNVCESPTDVALIVDPGKPCAIPVNFQQNNLGTDIGGGTLEVHYTWGSSTGNLNDLAACFIGERVAYPGDTNPWPFPPPFPAISANNPTLSMPGDIVSTAGNFDDDHSTPGNFRPPYSVTSFNTQQIYRFHCPCYNNDNWKNLAPDPNNPDKTMSIFRQVTNTLYPATWVFQICKDNIAPASTQANYSCALIKPLPQQ